MRILIDTNVVLDFLQQREPFVEDVAKLFEKIDAGEIEGFIAATTITNIYYIVRKAAGIVAAQDAITQILTDLYICPVDRSVIEQAIAFNFRDFEDAVQYACAIAHRLDVIVTRDVSGECEWGNSRSVTWGGSGVFQVNFSNHYLTSFIYLVIR